MPESVVPKRAAVRPRVISPITGEALLLEDLVRQQREAGCNAFEIVGDAGSGKTMALAHLAEILGTDEFVFRDNLTLQSAPSVSFGRTLVHSSRRATSDRPFPLASWTEDDLIEYLLAKAPEHCATVVGKFFEFDERNLLGGNPQLICLVADFLVHWPKVSIGEALEAAIQNEVPNDSVDNRAQSFSLQALVDFDTIWPWERHTDLDAFPRLRQLLNHDVVRVCFAAKHLASLLSNKFLLPRQSLPLGLIQKTAKLIENDRDAIEQLAKHLQQHNKTNVAMAASILHCLGVDWMPKTSTKLDLRRGHFVNADWRELNLRRILLDEADLTSAKFKRANLSKASLVGANCGGCDFEAATLAVVDARNANYVRANLQRANLSQSEFDGTNFREANLRSTRADRTRFAHADLTHASFQGSTLERASFVRAKLENTDFSGANLRLAYFCECDLRTANLNAASLNHTNLWRCNLENSTVEGADFSEANLKEAVLTGSHFEQVNLKRAKLRGAGLAEINWSNCDLTGVDFANCSFHLGSTRCGHVDSPYPSHGTRTGFYTEDFDSHQFQSPEEVRKAAMCGCRLFGADVWQADFYLVDLRGAQFDPKQEEHFRSCKAILDDWDGSL